MFRSISRLAGLLGLCVTLAAPAPAGAQQRDQGTFELAIRGITAGRLSFDGKIDGKSYAVVGKLHSSGILAMLRKIRFDAAASGRLRSGAWRPLRYEEVADTGRRQSRSRLEYVDGVPREMLKASRAGVPNYVDPATQGGTVDPLTALFAMLRTVKVAEACKLKLVMFDGARRSQISLSAAEVTGEVMSCSGDYRRLKGFSEAEMAEKRRFAFRVTYEPAGDGMVRISQIALETLYGRALLTRQ